MPTRATIANMVKFSPRHPIAFSPTTGEEYSANAADYWNAPNTDYCLTDDNGDDMFLVVRVSYLQDVAE